MSLNANVPAQLAITVLIGANVTIMRPSRKTLSREAQQ